MNIFEDVKGRVDNKEIAMRYLGRPQRTGSTSFYLSPFRKERTPSFSVSEKGFIDFGSGWQGDSISFVAEYFGLSPIEAAFKLSEDFNLGLKMEKQKSRYHENNFDDRNVRKGLYVWRNLMFDKLTELLKLCRKLKKCTEDLDLFFELVALEADLDEYTDILIYGSEIDWYQLFKKLGEKNAVKCSQ